MQSRSRESLLLWIILLLLLVQTAYALALWRLAGRAHFMIFPDVGRPRSEQPQKTFERREVPPGINPSARVGQPWGNNGRARDRSRAPGHNSAAVSPAAVLGPGSTAGVAMSPAVTAVRGGSV